MKLDPNRSSLFAIAIGLLLLISLFVSQPYKGIFVALYLVSGILFVAPRVKGLVPFRGIRNSLARRSGRLKKRLLIGLLVIIIAIGWFPISVILTPRALPDDRVYISIIPALLLLLAGIIVLSLGLVETVLCALGFLDGDPDAR